MAIRILVANDHPIFRAWVRALLDAQLDVEILVEGADGLGALEAARAHKPDVAVIDVSMPGMNGLETARRIAAEVPGVKVLCLTRHSDPRFMDAALRSGAHGYLMKECAREDLVAAIHTALADQIYVSPGLADAVLEGYRAEWGEHSPLSLLTERERAVLQLLAEGHTTQDIAARLRVSAKTVGAHCEHLKQKLGTQSLAGLTKFAIREGMTSTED
jgi:DNA-binding NarL/FixJ family response regulator